MADQTFGVKFNVTADDSAAAAMARLAAETQKSAAAQERLNKLAAEQQKTRNANAAGRDNANIAAAKVRLLGNFNEENRRRVDNAYAAKADRELNNEVRAAREEQRKAARAERDAARDVNRAKSEERRRLKDEERDAKRQETAQKKAVAESFGGRVDAATRRIQSGERVREELIRRGVIADPKLKEAARDRARLIQEQASGQKALMAGLLGQAGLGAGVSTFGNVTALGEAAKMAGYGGAGSAIGKAAVPLALAASGLEAGKAAFRLGQDEYLTDAQRERGFVRSNAVGRYISDTVDTFSGRARAMERTEENRERMAQVRAIEIERSQFRQTIDQRQADVTAGIRGGQALKGVFRGSTDRGTVEGRLAYEQESRLLPLRKQTAKAEQEYATAKYGAMNAQTNLNKLETEGEKLAENRLRLQKQLNRVGSGPVRQDVLYQLEDNAARQNANIAQQVKAKEVVAQQIGRREDAITGVNAARLAERQGGLDNLRMRESRAEDRAANLALLGPAGRIAGDTALRVIESVGIENAPPELVQQAQAKYPEKVRALAVAAGQQFEAEANVLSPEYNDRLADVRKKVDDEEESIERQSVQDTRSGLERQQKAVDAAATILETFAKRISVALDQFDNDQRARRGAQN